MRYETYRDGNNEWKWRAFALNGEIAAESIGGYRTLEYCEKMIDLDKERRLTKSKVKEVPKKTNKSLFQRFVEFVWGTED